MSLPVLLIELYPHSTGATCWACGESAADRKGIPVYEDLILHNDYQGDWGGQPACDNCFAAQESLDKPMPLGRFIAYAAIYGFVNRRPA